MQDATAHLQAAAVQPVSRDRDRVSLPRAVPSSIEGTGIARLGPA